MCVTHLYIESTRSNRIFCQHCGHSIKFPDEEDIILDNIIKNVNFATQIKGASVKESNSGSGSCLLEVQDFSQYQGATKDTFLTIDLGCKQICNYSMFRLYEKDSRKFKYKMEISSDFVDWKKIYESTSMIDHGYQAKKFKRQEVRYIRFQGESTSNPYFFITNLNVSFE
jgi:hypothetical protein